MTFHERDGQVHRKRWFTVRDQALALLISVLLVVPLLVGFGVALVRPEKRFPNRNPHGRATDPLWTPGTDRGGPA